MMGDEKTELIICWQERRSGHPEIEIFHVVAPQTKRVELQAAQSGEGRKEISLSIAEETPVIYIRENPYKGCGMNP